VALPELNTTDIRRPQQHNLLAWAVF